MLKTSLKWIGIIIALVGAAYSFYSQPLTVTIGVFLSLGLIYLVVVFLSREALYLYFAAAFLTLSYLLYLEQAVNLDFYALLGLPLFVLLYRVALLLEANRKDFSTALDIVGHSLAILWIGFIALNQGELSNRILIFFSIALYLSIDLFWYRWKGNPWHLMPLLITFSLLCAFLPHQFSLSAALYYLVVIIIYGQLSFFIARSQYQDAAKPVYSAGVVVALAGMVLAFWGELGWAGNIGLVLSSALFIMTMRAFRKWEFIYLMLLSLGVLAHNFLRVANDIHYTQLADYIRPIIVIMGLIFLYPFLKGVFKLKWSLSSFLIATRARTFFIFVPLLLFFFYFLFDYTMVVTENPYFCGSCHPMETPLRTWKAAVHYKEGAGCFACHYTPGLNIRAPDGCEIFHRLLSSQIECKCERRILPESRLSHEGQ